MSVEAPPQVDKSGHRVRHMFGEIAGKYDFLNHLLSGGTDIYWRGRTVRRVRPTQEGPILDVCTGTGDLAFAYAKRVPAAVPVVGSDFCHEMLEIARSKAEQRDSNVQFFEADTQELPFDSDEFQIVCVAFGLRNVTDTDRGLSEMVRVCQPGGRVAVLEFSMPRWQPFRAIYGWYFRHVLPWIGQTLARNRHAAYNYLPSSVMEFPEGQALADRMLQAGLSHVTFHSLTLGIATLYVGTK